MNKIIPNIGNSVNNRESMRRKMAQQPINRITTPLNVSFKGAESLLPEAEQKILNVFSQNYGSIGQNIIQKVDKLTNSQNLKDKTTQVLKKSSRFTIEQGALSIKEKSIWQSLAENVVFPIKSLPPYIGSWLLKKGESVPALKSTCENLYKKPIFRTPRKLNELNSKTDIIKGIFEKTQNIALDAAKKYDIKPEVIMDELSNVKDNPQASEAAKKASEYVKENLYKVSNKFFDKHTGNFNTAYERPLNRIVSGMIPVMFLANDAYNLSVLCGDKKEVSKKEAKQREKQEVSRVLTTAYIQLLTFGAFTKQVNTIPWVTPLTSAATVLFSEIFSRVIHGKPILFLTKEKAQAYNKKQNKKHDGKTETKNVNTMQAVPANNSQEPFKHLQMNPKKDSNIFKNFKADSQNLNSVQPSFIGGKTDDKNSGLAKNPVSSASNTSQSEKKEKPQKALINFSTFKKGVAFLISAGFALSFLKNSSYTKNSKIIKSIGDTGNFFKKNVYNKLAFKDFSISENEFKQVTDSLKEAGCKEIAEGHEFIKNKYGTIINNN
ncbi:MAG: hypothetical protein LUG16_01155, partial [Candidatus Gastranaerophilales bacterium]|nr:hypothetical protein [Candidatus Gastranaerophilales bacterium]